MRFGICTTPEHIAQAAALGFEYAELAASSLLTLSQETLEELRQSPLPIEAFNVLFPGTIQLIDGSSDEEIRAYLDATFKIIHDLGGRVVVFGSGRARNIPVGTPFDKAWTRLVEVTRMIGAAAKPYGIKVAVEPLRFDETNIIHTLTEGAILAQAADMDNVGLLADFYHMANNHELMSEIDVVPSLDHIHISAVGRGVPIFEETTVYQDFFDHLKANGYDGRISIESRMDNFASEAAAGLQVLKSLQ